MIAATAVIAQTPPQKSTPSLLIHLLHARNETIVLIDNLINKPLIVFIYGSVNISKEIVVPLVVINRVNQHKSL